MNARNRFGPLIKESISKRAKRKLGVIIRDRSVAAVNYVDRFGIVVTNAIVLIDRIKQNKDHMIIREAIIEAVATRIRPINNGGDCHDLRNAAARFFMIEHGWSLRISNFVRFEIGKGSPAVMILIPVNPAPTSIKQRIQHDAGLCTVQFDLAYRHRVELRTQK